MGTLLEAAQKLRAAMDIAGAKLDDATALDAMALYPLWAQDTQYLVDMRVRYENKLYKCIQAHTSLSTWQPPATPALWKLVSIEEWPEWIQPTGAHDAYTKGDKVTYNGEHYISIIDGNTYSPEAYPAVWEKQ